MIAAAHLMKLSGGPTLTLVLSGRLKPLADGRAIRCVATDGPPACTISTVIDQVAIEDPSRDVTLAKFGAS